MARMMTTGMENTMIYIDGTNLTDCFQAIEIERSAAMVNVTTFGSSASQFVPGPQVLSINMTTKDGIPFTEKPPAPEGTEDIIAALYALDAHIPKGFELQVDVLEGEDGVRFAPRVVEAP